MRSLLFLFLLAGSLMGCAGTIRENIDKLFMEGTKPVSYTHLTLPTKA